jgi:hypothetical protein
MPVSRIVRDRVDGGVRRSVGADSLVRYALSVLVWADAVRYSFEQQLLGEELSASRRRCDRRLRPVAELRE